VPNHIAKELTDVIQEESTLPDLNKPRDDTRRKKRRLVEMALLCPSTLGRIEWR
jgi:hypothetical protein